MKRYGLIGYPLGHSFSKKYFEGKFEKMGIASTHRYDLFEIEYLKDFLSIWDRYEDLVGVNVTVPHKINVMRFLDRLDATAQKVEAVNVIKKEGNTLVGYNSDIYGFKTSLQNWMNELNVQNPESALILGSGGSSKAVESALLELAIDYEIVSRSTNKGDLIYTALERDTSIMESHQLIINTTPLGMFPNVNDAPPIPYEQITPSHLLFDLIYNPEETIFMKEGREKGANVKGGLDMLHFQAEKAWEIWNNNEF